MLELAQLLRPMQLEAARHQLVSYASLSFYKIFTLTLDDWLAEYPGDPPAKADLAAVLDEWSLAFGSLALAIQQRPPAAR